MKPVVDANVLIRGRNKPFRSAVTAPSVYSELESEKAQNSFQNFDVEVREPGEKAVKKVRSLSREINSPTSDADEQLVALALETGGKLISDDLAVQNLARHLDLEYDSFLSDRIDETRTWKMVCENCGRTVDGSECVCGSTALQRKPG
jgi:UPF0271 protein